MKPQLIVIPVLLTLTAALVINMNPAPESPAKTVEEQQALSFTEDFLRRFTGSDTDLATCRFSQKQFPGHSHEHEEHAGMRLRYLLKAASTMTGRFGVACC
ncbi:MAG TPA: hypothetical protein DCG12_07240 [Planctomycetaceae bacterium]|nr:hypothetical protein [Planctomycetaceae bacterium]